MSCSGLHCDGCGGGSRLASVLVAGAIALGLYGGARSVLVGLSATAAEVNRILGLAVAVVLVVAAVTAGGWVLLARRRRLREDPFIAAFSAEVQAALDARHPTAKRLAPVQRAVAHRVDRRVEQGPAQLGGR